MSKQIRKRQHLERQKEEENGNELQELKVKMAALEAKNGVLSESLTKVKEENEALREKLKENKRHKCLKNELEEFIRTSRQQKEETTNNNNSGELEIPQNLLDRHLIPLPLELNCQIFECLKFGIQRKFIGGLGRGIYAIFRQKVLTKSKRLRNPEQNGWKIFKTSALISFNGLLVSDNTETRPNIFAKKGFPITCELSRTDNFPGTILYYFEVTNMSSYERILVGLSSGNLPNGSCVGSQPNSYAIQYGCDRCWLSGKKHYFEWPNGAIKPIWNGKGDVIGCGLMMNPANELSIFFTGNGLLMGRQIAIDSTVDLLYPTVILHGNGKVSVKANFGDDSTKPFKYDIRKCPGNEL